MRWIILMLFFASHTQTSFAQVIERDSTRQHSWTPYVLGSAAVLTAVCFANDQQISDELFAWKQRHQTVKDLSPLITLGGEAVIAYGFFAGLGGVGYLADDPGMIDVAKIGIISVTGTGLAVQLLKRSFGRERPPGASKNGGRWHGPALFTDYDSFPSGHATTAFTVATVLTDMHEDTPWLGYVLYPLAGAVGVSRITERRHWASDVVVGALLGTYGTKAILYAIRSSSMISVVPRISSHSVGMEVEIRVL